MPRSWRLTRGSDIRSIIEGGFRKRAGRLSIFWANNDLGNPRAGIVVPRYGHGAVERNRLRRRIREALRRNVLPTLTPVDLVVRAAPAAYQARFVTIVEDLENWSKSLRGS